MSPREGVDTAVVRRCPVFAAIGEADLIALLRSCRTLSRPAGTLLFSAGQSAGCFYVVLSGRVKVFHLSERGEEQILHLCDPGDAFGEAAMWAGGDYPAGAEVADDARLLVVPRDVLRDAISGHADLAMGMMAGMSAKLREFAALIESLSLKEVPARVAGVLWEQAGRGRLHTFKLKQSKRHLAGQIGTAPETLSRALAKLKADDVIDVAGSTIRVLDASRLARLAGEKMPPTLGNTP